MKRRRPAVERVARESLSLVPEQVETLKEHFSLDDKVRLEDVKFLNLTRDMLFVCRDAALDDETAAKLALQCRLGTI
jgi:hypothetical protein